MKAQTDCPDTHRLTRLETKMLHCIQTILYASAAEIHYRATTKERVEELLAQGLKHREISKRLHISLRASRYHASTLRKKYKVANREELAEKLRSLRQAVA